ncbi:hypothetical protein [Actinophytocola sp. NPDC049390]|uniref:hypothetical protein n=1 Tax=Actinophytocola sp. NPDC049390 TaxID=3363894 RepID=UPI0037B39C14
MSDEQRLQELFAEVEAPPGLDRWRERIADVHVEHEHTEHDGGTVTELRPRKHKARSLAVAAAVVGIVGLGCVVVMGRLLEDAPSSDPTMIIDGPDRTTSPARTTSPTSPSSSPSTIPNTTGPTGR